MAHTLLHPLVLGGLCLLFAVLMHKWGILWLARIAWVGGGLWFFAIIFTPLPDWLASSWERSVSGIESIAGKDGNIPIVVLGKGYTNDTSLLPGKQLSPGMMQRVVEGVRLYHQSPREMIFGGPSGNGRTAQSRIAAQTAIQLGVDPSHAKTLPEALTTAEEARAFRELRPDADTLILVTSALHMRRAKMLFERLGTHPMPAPSDYRVKFDQQHSSWWLPSFRGIGTMDRWIHECVGYWMAL